MLRNERVNEHIRFKYRNLIEKKVSQWMNGRKTRTLRSV